MSSSDKSVFLRAWSESVAKNMEMFKEGTEMMVRDHQKSNVKTSSFAIHLQHMSSRETSAPVKASLETLSARLDAAESDRLKVLAQLQALIVNRFAKYPGEIKVQRTNIDRRNQTVSQYAKANKEYASAKSSSNTQKLAIASGNLRVAEEHMRSSEDVLNKELGDFELQRVAEMKDMLRRYIRNQIFFHAKHIEGLTAAYQEVMKIDPETEKAIFLRRIRELEFQDVKRPPLSSPTAAQQQQQPQQTHTNQPQQSPSAAQQHQHQQHQQQQQQQHQQQQPAQSPMSTGGQR